jgi:hypothetical protein
MRQQILDDINFVIQNNYGGSNPQFIQETKPSLLKEEDGGIDAEEVFKKPEEEKEKTYKIEFTADEVHTLEMALSVAHTRAVDVKHSMASAIKKVLEKIHQNR